jgi:hypothetical protein
MNAVNMPGFTADASLYKTSECYQSVATRDYSCGEERVVSQIGVGGGLGGLGDLDVLNSRFSRCYERCRADGLPWLRCLIRCW